MHDAPEPEASATPAGPPPRVGVVVPTLNAGPALRACLEPVLASPLRPRVLVVDSASTDGTPQLARSLGAEVLPIQRHEFNHGATREMARRRLDTPIVVMLTQDAIPRDASMLATLTDPIEQGRAALAYTRQVPHQGEGYFGRFLRDFNYPPESHVRSMDDLPRFGLLLTFCSNACCAYDQQALTDVGGFEPTLSWEDQLAAAKLLRAGGRIAYVAEAVVRHSHSYSLAEDFARAYDTGYVRRVHAEALESFGSAEGRGGVYARRLLGDVARHRPHWMPYAVAHLGAKWLGYRAGSLGDRLPRWLARRLSATPGYFRDPPADTSDAGLQTETR